MLAWFCEAIQPYSETLLEATDKYNLTAKQT